MATTSRHDSAGQVLAAIDVGTNAVRLELARPLPDGTLETLHEERDPVRPGEGVFRTGSIPPEVADRLLATLRRYGALARRFHAQVRAVATSAVREARNRDEIIRRARDEAGLDLEVVSGREEARLICLGVLHQKPAHAQSLVVDIGGGSTEVAYAIGEVPHDLWSVGLGAVRVTEIFDAADRLGRRKLAVMRSYAEEAFREAIPAPKGLPRVALGSSGTIKAVIAYAAAEGTAHATAQQLTRAVERLAAMDGEKRRRHFDSRRAEIVAAGAVVLEAAMRHLKLQSITSVERGLRDGLLVDALRRGGLVAGDSSLPDAALEMGRRFGFDEAHARKVASLALALFDELAMLHDLPASARPLLEVAALLHDVGRAVSHHRHHRHSAYLIQNADLPGVTNRERELVALVARFHRRTAPDRSHALLAELGRDEFQLVRKLSTLLRLADSLDRSHHQPVESLRAAVRASAVGVRLVTSGPVDLELWDTEHETELFRKVFGKRLELAVARAMTER